METGIRQRVYLRRDELSVVLRRHGASFLNHVADHVVVRNVAPQVDAHGLLAVEQRVCHAADLAEHDVRNRPRVRVLLQRAHVQADRLLDDVVLAVGDEERPV